MTARAHCQACASVALVVETWSAMRSEFRQALDALTASRELPRFLAVSVEKARQDCERHLDAALSARGAAEMLRCADLACEALQLARDLDAVNPNARRRTPAMTVARAELDRRRTLALEDWARAVQRRTAARRA